MVPHVNLISSLSEATAYSASFKHGTKGNIYRTGLICYAEVPTKVTTITPSHVTQP